MHINRLVGAIVAALLMATQGRATDEARPANVIAGGDVEALQSAVMDDTAACCRESDSHCHSESWQRFLIGSTNAYHVQVGTEFTALHAESETGGRITLSFSDTTAPGTSTVSFNDASGVDDWGYAPRVWLGAQLTDKWGVRGRYWRFSDTDQHSPDVAPGTTPTGTNFATIFTTDHVEAWTSDVEAVRSGELWGFKLDGFVGGRHASFSTDSDLLAFGVFTTGNFVNLTLQNGSGFDGNGVTYGGTVRRQIGSSHLYGFSSIRGSNLVGYSNSFGRADGAVASSPSAPLVGAATVRRNHSDAELTIFELQAGLEYEWALREIPANFLLRTAYEYQQWDVNGNPTGGAGFGGTIGELTTNSFASAGLGGMALHGVSISTGLTW